MRTFNLHKQKPIYKTMKIRKEIAFAYPTSINASRLGFKDSGCYHLSVTHLNIDGNGQCETFIPSPAQGFLKKDDPQLLEAFELEKGENWNR